MEIRKASLTQIRQQSLEALTKALGPVGMVRFLQQFELRGGDYTHDREQWLQGVTVEQAVAEIKQHRKKTD